MNAKTEIVGENRTCGFYRGVVFALFCLLVLWGGLIFRNIAIFSEQAVAEDMLLKNPPSVRYSGSVPG